MMAIDGPLMKTATSRPKEASESDVRYPFDGKSTGEQADAPDRL
jgi:hypothetical protein